MPTTDVYELPYPTDVEPADVPLDIEALAKALDRLGGMFLPGDLKMTAAIAAPEGWLLCDGRAVERALYPRLFEAIGTAYGVGDGSTTFNLPNLVQRVPAGAGPAWPLGWAGGDSTHALTVGEMPHHAHGVSDPTHAHSVADPAHTHPLAHGGQIWGDAHAPFRFSGEHIPMGGTWINNAGVGVGIYGAYTGIGIYGEGGSGAHNNVQPTVTVNFFVKT